MSEGKIAMNWEKRIKRAEINRGFSSRDEKLAYSFRTCAVSEHPKLQGKKYTWNSITNDLYMLGNAFYNQVKDNNFSQCEYIRQYILKKGRY